MMPPNPPVRIDVVADSFIQALSLSRLPLNGSILVGSEARMARCPECKTAIAPWRTLVPETKSKPLVCRKCGTVLRMKPGWLMRIGVIGSLVAVIALRPIVVHRSSGLTLATIALLIAGELCFYALFAPTEKADGVEGNGGAG